MRLQNPASLVMHQRMVLKGQGTLFLSAYAEHLSGFVVSIFRITGKLFADTDNSCRAGEKHTIYYIGSRL